VVAYQYDECDRLIAEGSEASTWDANGNLQTRGGRSYYWDVENRLRRVMEGTEILAEADYDADGELVRLSEPIDGVLESTTFLVDTAGLLSHAVAEIDDQGAAQSLYTRAGNLLLSAFRPGDGGLDYFHADGLGSIRMITDPTANVVAHDDYRAFGGRDSINVGPYGFAGERFVASVGLGYHRARWLDSSTGRFLSVDPFQGTIGSPLSQHRYLYAHANPVSNVDPTGLFIGGGGMSEFNLATAIQGVLVGMNAASLVGNTFYALAYGKRAARALLAGEIFDGLAFAMAGVLYAGLAAASLVGLLAAFTPIPPPSGFAGGFALATTGGRQALQAQSIWTAVASNPKLWEWALKQVLPAIIGSHLMFATAANGGAGGGGSSSGSSSGSTRP
ncbi:MAG: RHS repeat-associated core domain-containing protein, partial [bacterium]|nr:RHS repeat-associated core domain-containing protein [bacterium]